MEAFSKDRAKRLAENYQLLQKEFKLTSVTQKRLAAFYYAQLDRPIPADAVRQQEKHIRKSVSPLSGFRGLAILPLAAQLTLRDDPKLFERTESIYQRLRQSLPYSDHLILASLALAVHADTHHMDTAVERFVALHAQLKKTYRVRLRSEERVLLARLALQEEPVENLVAQIALCFDGLKTEFSASGPLLGLSLYLVLCGNPSDGLMKVVDLSRKFREYGQRVSGRNYMPVLGLLSNADKDLHTVIQETTDLHEFLKKEKGFSAWYVQKYELLLYIAGFVAQKSHTQERRDHQPAYISAVATGIALAQQAAVANL